MYSPGMISLYSRVLVVALLCVVLCWRERCQVSFANLVVAGSDGEDRMPDRSVFTALPSTAGTFLEDVLTEDLCAVSLDDGVNQSLSVKQ